MSPQLPVIAHPAACTPPSPRVALPVLINAHCAHPGLAAPYQKTPPASPCNAVCRPGGVGYPSVSPRRARAADCSPARRPPSPAPLLIPAEKGRASPMRGMCFVPASPRAQQQVPVEYMKGVLGAVPSPRAGVRCATPSPRALQQQQLPAVLAVMPSPRASPIAQAVAQQCPAKPMQILEGMQVDYWSESNSCWLPASAVKVDAVTGKFELDCKPGAWMSMEAANGRPPVRPRTRPTQAQLHHIRDLLHDGQLLSEADALFHRHATAAGVEEAALLMTSVGDLSREVDELLGIAGSAVWIRQRMREASDVRLLKDDFTTVLCKNLWKVYAEYGKAFATANQAPRRSGDPEQTYQLGKALGQGTFGDVFLAYKLDSKARFAVKRVSKNVPPPVAKELEQEIANLSTLDHPHIIKLYEYYDAPEHMFLVTDFCPGGDLKDVVDKATLAGRYVEENLVSNVMHQVMTAIAHVHARGLMHLDLKPANVMLMPSCATVAPAFGRSGATAAGFGDMPHAMVIDLGVSCLFHEFGTHRQAPRGTPLTMAPEVWAGKLTPKADVFSLGVMLFNLLSNHYPYQSPMDQKEALSYWGYTGSAAPDAPWEKIAHATPSARSLCRTMMLQRRHRRPTASDCLKMEFLEAHEQAEPVTSCPATGSKPGPLGGAFTKKILQQLSATRLRTPLQKSVSFLIARQWPSNTLPSIKRAFQALDHSRSGWPSKAHVERSLNQLGLEPSESRAIVDAMDLNCDGMIDWTEFIAACIEPADEKLNADLEAVFRLADKDSDGLVSAEDLATLLQAEHLRGGAALHEALDGLIDSNLRAARVNLAMFREYFRSERSKASPSSSNGAPAKPPVSPRIARSESPRTPIRSNQRALKKSGSWFDGLARQLNEKARQLRENGRVTSFAPPSRGSTDAERPKQAERPPVLRDVSPKPRDQWQQFLGWVDAVMNEPDA